MIPLRTLFQKTHLKLKIVFTPKNRNHSVETYCRLVELEFENHFKKNIFTHKKKKNQQKALSELESGRSIVIKAADKGGAIVIMDKYNYDNEILRLKIHLFIKRSNVTQPRNTLGSCKYYLKGVFSMVIFLLRSQNFCLMSFL